MKIGRWLLPLIFAYGLTACNGNGENSDNGDIGADPETNGNGDYIEESDSGFVPDYDDSDEFFSNTPIWHEGMSSDWHGEEVRIWYSENSEDDWDAYQTEDDYEFTAPEGATAIKQVSLDGDRVEGYAIMTKLGDDFDPDKGNWHYENRTRDGMWVQQEGGARSLH